MILPSATGYLILIDATASTTLVDDSKSIAEAAYKYHADTEGIFFTKVEELELV